MDMETGAIDAALEIAERFAIDEEKLRASILNFDLQAALGHACSLTGLDGAIPERAATLVREVESAIADGRPLVALDIACKIIGAKPQGPVGPRLVDSTSTCGD
jgi:hypothetical protein